jgi:2Fe-2S ferredoxin
MKVVNITFRFEDGSPEETHMGVQGESVLDVALNNNIELQHNCGGVCGCSTCHVYVEQGMDGLPDISDREEDYIDRAVNPKINSRLACQCLVQTETEDLTVLVPKQEFLGH